MRKTKDFHRSKTIFSGLALVFAITTFTKLVDRPGTEKMAANFGIPLPIANPAEHAFTTRWMAVSVMQEFGIKIEFSPSREEHKM